MDEEIPELVVEPTVSTLLTLEHWWHSLLLHLSASAFLITMSSAWNIHSHVKAIERLERLCVHTCRRMKPLSPMEKERTPRAKMLVSLALAVCWLSDIWYLVGGSI